MKYCPVIEDIVLEDDCRGCDECRLQDDEEEGVFIMEKQNSMMFNEYAERVIYSDFTGSVEHFINYAQKPEENKRLLNHLNSQINYMSTLLLCYTNIGNNYNLATIIKNIRRNIERIALLHPYHHSESIDIIKELLTEIRKNHPARTRKVNMRLF